MAGPTSSDISTTPPERKTVEAGDKSDDSVEEVVTNESQVRIDLRKELYDSTKIDPVLAKKMALVNDAIDEIGMTPFQWKLFFLNGFGYAVDSVSDSRHEGVFIC